MKSADTCPNEDKYASQTFKLGLHSSLKDRDTIIRENAMAMRYYNAMKNERDRSNSSLAIANVRTNHKR